MAIGYIIIAYINITIISIIARNRGEESSTTQPKDQMGKPRD